LKTRNIELDEAFCQTHPDARPGGHVLVTVADTGVGMDEGTAAHAFEPFFTTKAPGEGTGLGLATVYGVIAQSGGHIYVSTAPGRGSIFEIYLPRFDHPPVRTEPGIEAVAAESGLKTVLVVDQDVTFRSLTTRILEKRGFRVLPAINGEQAAALLGSETTPIHLLLTELVLPGTTQGMRVAQVAADRRPGLPVVFMSTETRDAVVKSGRLEESADYLEKPFTAEHLTRRIRELLGTD